jgi:hypothetical protein
MLKRKIDKAAFDALPDPVKAEYKQVGSNYLLDTDDAVDALAARDHEKQRADGLATELATVKTTLAATETKLTDALKGNGTPDVAALEDSYKQKLADQKKGFEGTIGKLTNHLTKQLVESVADTVAKDISTSPALIRPHIISRLKAEVDGDNALTRVLDKDGKPSAASIDDLKQELVANPDFKAIIIASKATGGRAPFGTPAPGAVPPNNPNNPGNDGQPPNLAKMKPAELAAHVKATKAAAAQT